MITHVISATLVAIFVTLLGAWRRYSAAGLIALFLITWIAAFAYATVYGVPE